jgi:hypothetical protein
MGESNQVPNQGPFVRDKRFAQPGDSDLDFDVDGITLVSVLTLGREIMLQFEGGFGTWKNEGDVDSFVAQPGDPTSGIAEVHVTMSWPTLPQDDFDQMLERLEEWRRAATPLRMCSAQGRLASIIEDNSKFLFIPRNDFP